VTLDDTKCAFVPHVRAPCSTSASCPATRPASH
jgi:hypothetical protein